MRGLILFVVVLLSGIVRGTEGDSPASLLLSTLRKVNEPNADRLYEEIKEKCRKNGGGEDALLIANERFQKCSSSVVNLNELQRLLNKGFSSFGVEEIKTKYCPKAAVIQKCLDEYVSALSTCLDGDGADFMTNLARNFVNLVCVDEGKDEHDTELAMKADVKCIEEKKVGIMQCVREVLGHGMPSEHLSGFYLPFFVFNGNQCSEYTKVQECLASALKSCQRASKDIDVFMERLRSGTNCERSIVSEDHQRAIRSVGNRVVGALQEFQHQELLVRVPREVFVTDKRAMDEAMKSLYQQCKMRHNERVANEAIQAVQGAGECMNNARTYSAASTSFSGMCRNMQDATHKCLKDVTYKIKPCMNTTTEYIPDFILEIFDSVFRYLCSNEGANLKDVTLLMTDPCMENVAESLSTCSKDTKSYKTPNDIERPKEDICRDMNLLKRCAEDSYRNHCQNRDPNRVFNSFIDSLYAPCAGCCLSVTSFLFLGLLVFVAKIF